MVELGVGIGARLAGCATGAEGSNGALGDNRTTSMLISPHTRLVISQQSLSLLFQKKKNFSTNSARELAEGSRLYHAIGAPYDISKSDA
jgi:hypothetical protein